MEDSNKKKDVNPDVLHLSKEPIVNEIDEENTKAFVKKIYVKNMKL